LAANLVAGMPVLVVVRLSVPPTAQEGDLCRLRLAWNDPGQGERREVTAPLSLPVMDATWESLAPNTDVQERAALLLIARAKKAATLCLERGDRRTGAGAGRPTTCITACSSTGRTTSTVWSPYATVATRTATARACHRWNGAWPNS
jgi:Ca-activated chloride channel family protein